LPRRMARSCGDWAMTSRWRRLQRHPAPQWNAIASPRADFFNRLRPDVGRLGSKAVDPSIRVSTGLRDLGEGRSLEQVGDPVLQNLVGGQMDRIF
jgi:hypothetical protein